MVSKLLGDRLLGEPFPFILGDPGPDNKNIYLDKLQQLNHNQHSI
jgi:hypothetical protein